MCDSSASCAWELIIVARLQLMYVDIFILEKFCSNGHVTVFEGACNDIFQQ